MTWVIANTNTRSHSSSTGRGSPLSRRCRAWYRSPREYREPAAVGIGFRPRMKLGVYLGYLIPGASAGRPARGGPGGRAAGLRLGVGGRGLRIRRGHRAGLAGRAGRARSSSARRSSRCRLAARRMTAMTAATIDMLSGGRMLLGIGTSGPQVAEGWHGQRFARQLQRTREYVAVVRMALARERVEYHGETLELPLPDGPGQAAQADDLAGAGADPDLPGGDRAQEHRAGRRDRRRLAADLLLARARLRGAGAARGGRRSGPGARSTTSTWRRRSTRTSPTTARPARATGCARSSRCTSAGWARASRTSTTSWSSATASRTRPAQVQDLYLDGQEGGGRGGAPRRADRPDHAVRAPRRTCAIAWPPSATPASAR